MAATTKKIALITGANSGIGFELAVQLLSKGSYHVLLGSRSLDKGGVALSQLNSLRLSGTASLLHLDLTSDESIRDAFATVKSAHDRIDILVNNAAVATMSDLSLRDQMRVAFDTNATGPLILTQTFLPLLRASASLRIINVSSGAGSIARRLDNTSALYKMKGGELYRASKAALHMITACQVAEYGEFGIKVFAYDPGFTVSNLSSHNTVQNGARSTKESVEPLVDVLEGKRDTEAGHLLHNTGQWPW